MVRKRCNLGYLSELLPRMLSRPAACCCTARRHAVAPALVCSPAQTTLAYDVMHLTDL